MSQASQSWDSHRELWQSIVNALEVPPRRAQVAPPDPVPCVARIVWERDGEELVETHATAWTTRAVLVRITSPRWRIAAVWIPARDVRRPTQ